MNFLFLHNNYPGQYRHIAAALAADPQNQVFFLSEFHRQDLHLPGVKLGKVTPVEVARGRDRALDETMLLLRRGEAFGNAMLSLRSQGFVPDAIYDHCGFGCGLFSSDVFPKAKRISYFEWFFNNDYPHKLHETNAHAPANFASQRMRNQFQLDALVQCDVGISPMQWQRAQYPEILRSKIQVLHEGVDQKIFYPLQVGQARPFRDKQLPMLDTAEEIVTYTTRAFEPVRGFPEFVRAIPAILEARPGCHIVLMGQERVSYDPPRRDGKSWLRAMLEEVPLDKERVHILGFSSYHRYADLLRSSDVHVYLTLPYVLSWSLLEAMCCGCLIAASATPPVQEVLRDGENGLLMALEPTAIAKRVSEALQRKQELTHLGQAARQDALRDYSVQNMLPRHLQLLQDILTN